MAEMRERDVLLQDASLHALIYYLAVSYVRFSRGAFLPAVPLRSLYVRLLLCSDLDIVPTLMLLLHAFNRMYFHNGLNA